MMKDTMEKDHADLVATKSGEITGILKFRATIRNDQDDR